MRSRALAPSTTVRSPTPESSAWRRDVARPAVRGIKKIIPNGWSVPALRHALPSGGLASVRTPLHRKGHFAAPESATPLEAVGAALDAATATFTAAQREFGPQGAFDITADIAAQDPAASEAAAEGADAAPGADTGPDARGVSITTSAISRSRPTLDDMFLTLTGRSLRDDSPGGDGTNA